MDLSPGGGLVRLVQAWLVERGYLQAAKSLEAEAGCRVRAEEAATLKSALTRSDWTTVRQLLSNLLPLAEDSYASLLVEEYRYREMLSRGERGEAVQQLRTRLAPLLPPDRLHELAVWLVLGEQQNQCKVREEDNVAWLLDCLDARLPPERRLRLPFGQLQQLIDSALVHDQPLCRGHGWPHSCDPIGVRLVRQFQLCHQDNDECWCLLQINVKLVVGTRRGHLHLLDLHDPISTLSSVEAGLSLGVKQLYGHGDDKVIAVGRNGQLGLFSLQGDELHPLRVFFFPEMEIGSVLPVEDGLWLSMVSQGEVWLVDWQGQTKKQLGKVGRIAKLLSFEEGLDCWGRRHEFTKNGPEDPFAPGCFEPNSILNDGTNTLVYSTTHLLVRNETERSVPVNRGHGHPDWNAHWIVGADSAGFCLWSRTSLRPLRQISRDSTVNQVLLWREHEFLTIGDDGLLQQWLICNERS